MVFKAFEGDFKGFLGDLGLGLRMFQGTFTGFSEMLQSDFKAFKDVSRFLEVSTFEKDLWRCFFFLFGFQWSHK